MINVHISVLNFDFYRFSVNITYNIPNGSYNTVFVFLAVPIT